MDWLNYHHLLYFWATAKHGSVAAACNRLHLAQPTVSGQIKKLERALGGKLFVRRGRGLALTELGKIVFRYSDEIFTLGRELLDVARGRGIPGGPSFRVGIADVIPKLVAYRLLAPALDPQTEARLVCREDRAPRLLAELATHDLDLVISDSPIGSAGGVRGFNHLLGESEVAVYATAPAARRLARTFPHSLQNERFLLPLPGTSLRQSLDTWFESLGLRPRIVGEFDDSALMKVFAGSGAGAMAAPVLIEEELSKRYGMQRIGLLPDARERYYIITGERRIQHPATRRLTEAAKKTLQ